MQRNLDLLRVNGDDSWTFSVPARYVIGQDGVIVAADYDPDYTRRPEATKTIEVLKNFKSD